MIKLFCLNFLVVFCGASVIHVPLRSQNVETLEYSPSSRGLEKIQEKWEPHIIEFLNLIDVEKLSGVVLQYVSDPDVVNFINFLGSKAFKDVVLELEDVEEFKEAVNYLESKGYEIKTIIDLVNSLLDLQSANTQIISAKNGNGMTKFVEELIRALPIEDMKKLFEEKLETSSDVSDLFETLSSEEYKDIMKRMSENPKILEIKNVFETYGLDFNELSLLLNDIVGDYFEKISGQMIIMRYL